jgi:hypothetical protein
MPQVEEITNGRHFGNDLEKAIRDMTPEERIAS